MAATAVATGMPAAAAIDRSAMHAKASASWLFCFWGRQTFLQLLGGLACKAGAHMALQAPHHKGLQQDGTLRNAEPQDSNHFYPRQQQSRNLIYTRSVFAYFAEMWSY